MSDQIIRQFEQRSLKEGLKIPDIRTGQVLRVHQKIKEGEKERVQIFEGLVIKTSSGSGVGKTFTIRKVVDDIGVEKVFPIYSPSIEKIQIVREGKIRRSKLYYMRGRSGKATKLYDKARI